MLIVVYRSNVCTYIHNLEVQNVNYSKMVVNGFASQKNPIKSNTLSKQEVGLQIDISISKDENTSKEHFCGFSTRNSTSNPHNPIDKYGEVAISGWIKDLQESVWRYVKIYSEISKIQIMEDRNVVV